MFEEARSERCQSIGITKLTICEIETKSEKIKPHSFTKTRSKLNIASGL